MAVRRFLLPDLGEGLEDAEVVAWHVAEGDRVELNQTLAEVNTAKALVEIPAPWEGVVTTLHAAEGEVVAVGAPLVSIEVAAEDAEDAKGAEGAEGAEEEATAGAAQAAEEVGEPAAREAGDEAAREGEEATPRRTAVLVGYGVEEETGTRGPSRRRRGRPGGGHNGPVPASPPVRRLAKDLGVDLATVRASGPEGRVTRDDVMLAAGSAGAAGGDMWPREPAPQPFAEVAAVAERIPVRGIRRLIAEKMARSAREIPHVTTFLTVDATQVQAFRAEVAAEAGVRVSPLPIVVRALVETCAAYPALNASFDAARPEIVRYRDVHVGIATDTDRGLLVTVVRDAQTKGIAELAEEIARLADAARRGTARPEDVTGSTVTVSNVGTFGAEYGTPIINFPEAAILAVGVIEPRALVVDGRVEARPAMTLSLSFDHRVMDGAEAGRALRSLGALLESPFKLGALPR